MQRKAKSEHISKRSTKKRRYIPPSYTRSHQAMSLIITPQVLEYTLFQPGLLVDMLAPEGSSSKYLKSQELFIDFSKRRAIILSGKESCFSLSTMNDVANVVARAVEYEGEWPVIGGMRGSTITGTELLEIGAKARGTYIR